MITIELNPKVRYLIAVSGGPDSMSLLDLAYKSGAFIVVAHVNYHLRDTSNRDQQIVEIYCKNRGIPLYTHAVDSPPKGNLQTWARIIRYRFFASLANQYHLNEVLVAHHLDDCVESFLMQIDRASMVDWYGISRKSYLFGLAVNRPLLRVRKNELVEYCNRFNISYGIDETNNKTIYTRNKYRKIIEKWSHQEFELVVHKMDHMNNELTEISNEVNRYNEANSLSEKLNTDLLLNLSLLAQYRVVDGFLRLHTKRPEHYRHAMLANIIHWIKEGKDAKGFAIRQWRLVKEGAHVIFIPNLTNTITIHSWNDFPVVLGDYTIAIDNWTTGEGIGCDIDDFPLQLQLPPPSGLKMKINGKLRPVSKILAAHHIPHPMRSTHPVLLNHGGEVLGIVGILTHKGALNRKYRVFVLK